MVFVIHAPGLNELAKELRQAVRRGELSYVKAREQLERAIRLAFQKATVVREQPEA